MKGINWRKHLPAMMLALFLVAYNIVRVFKVPITHDEAETYWLYATASFKNITANIPVTANNHMLNSLITKVFIGIFGHHIFFLRLGNILAQIAYLAFSYRLCHKLFRSDRWVLMAFVLLNFNPFLFDFWGLSRGYGLSLAFMMASLYYFIRFKIENDPGAVWASLILGVLSVYSSFSALNYYVALIGVLVFWSLATKQLTIRTVTLPVVAISMGLYALVAHPLIELNDSGEFYFGSTEGVVNGTIASIIKETVFGSPKYQSYYTLAAGLFTAVHLAIGIFWGSRLFVRRARREVQLGFSVWCILMLILLSLKTQFILLDTPYIIERSALFLYPLAIVVLVYWIYTLELWQWARTSVVAVLMALAVMINFAFNVNTRYARSWRFNMHDKELMSIVIAEQDGHRAKLKLYWAFVPSFRYNAKQLYPGKFQQIEKRGQRAWANTRYDYYYIHRDQLAEVPDGYRLIKSYEDGRYRLYGAPLAFDRP